MRNIYPKKAILVLLAVVLSVGMIGQDEEEKKNEKKKEKIKKGWNFGGLPVVSYDSDLGLQLGALVNAYNYGDGSRYPVYDHSLYVEGSWFLKGSQSHMYY